MTAGLMLPRAVALAGGGIALAVIDYAVDELAGTADANGNVTLTFDQVEIGYLWRVERIVVTTTQATKTVTVAVYAGDATPMRLRDSVPLPAGFSGVAEYPALLTIPSGQSLIVVIGGGTTGDKVTASVQYQLVQRTGA